MSEPRTKECIEECGEILPCSSGALENKGPINFECTLYLFKTSFP